MCYYNGKNLLYAPFKFPYTASTKLFLNLSFLLPATYLLFNLSNNLLTFFDIVNGLGCYYALQLLLNLFDKLTLFFYYFKYLKTCIINLKSSLIYVNGCKTLLFI